MRARSAFPRGQTIHQSYMLTVMNCPSKGNMPRVTADETEPLDSAAAWLRARTYAQQAEQTQDAEHRQSLLRLRNSWIEIANELQLLEMIDGAQRNPTEI
jgi:hypothetical protein